MGRFDPVSNRTLSADLAGHNLVQELELCAAAYDLLSDTTFSFLTRTRQFIGNLDSQFFDLFAGILGSIRALVLAGSFGDAYTLLRRFSDLSWRHVNVMLRLQEPSAIDELFADDVGEMTSGRFVELAEVLWSKGIYVEEIESWLSGACVLPKNKKLDHFAPSIAVKEVYALLDRDKFCAINDRCNNHVHLNHFVTLRLSGPYLSHAVNLALLDQLGADFRDLYIRHIAMTFSINPPYMGSSDYIDSLEYGREPVEGSQYWVAPFVQELFDRVITVYRPDIAACIKNQLYMDLS